MAKTMYEKIWNEHVVHSKENEATIIYVDRHLVHEVTSPQAFDGLRMNKRTVKHPELTFATMDHNVSTKSKDINQVEETSRIQMNALSKNCEEFGIKLFDFEHEDRGIVHVIGPEMGITQPGMVIVCGDSHTSRLLSSFSCGTGSSGEGIGSSALSGCSPSGGFS